MTELNRVTVLGTGLLGTPVALNLCRRDFAVTVWNRTPAGTAEAARGGCRPCADVVDAVAGAEAVVTILADADATEDVLLSRGTIEAMRPGSLLVQSGTIGLAATERIASVAAAAGVLMLDAPVSGSTQPALDGTLTILAGGEESARAAAAPLLAAMGRRTVWAGRVGDGTRLKLIVQTWLVALVEAVAETVALSESEGLDPALFLSAIAGGPIDVPYAQLKGTAMRDRNFEATFPLKHMLKDVELARTLAGDEIESLAPMLALVASRCRAALALGHGEQDMSAIFCATGRPPHGRPSQVG